MKFYFVVLIFPLLNGSCKSRIKSKDIISNKIFSYVFYDNILTIEKEDSLKYSYTSDRYQFPNWYDSRKGFCALRNDSLFFSFHDGVMGGFSLDINIAKDSTKVVFEKSDCTSKTMYTSLAYKITVNKKSFSVGDTILADIFFKGLAYANGREYFKNDTVTVDGKIKLVIRDSAFNYTRLYEENRLVEFYALLRQRPDTITKFDLSFFGLTDIPRELVRFENLKELTVSENNLSTANFSVLANFKKLIVLKLQNCQLKEVPSSIFQLKGLEILNLYGNNLNNIPDELYSLTSLKDLCIGYNNLTSLSPKIANLISLESLETSATDIRVYPDAMSRLKRLKEVYPSDTMRYIPASLKKYVWGCDYFD